MESVYTPLSTNQGMEGMGRREKVAENPDVEKQTLVSSRSPAWVLIVCKDTVESSRWCFSARSLHTHPGHLIKSRFRLGGSQVTLVLEVWGPPEHEVV